MQRRSGFERHQGKTRVEHNMDRSGRRSIATKRLGGGHLGSLGYPELRHARAMTSRSVPVRIFLISLVLILTGCAGSGRSIEQAPPAIAAPTSQEPVPADRVSPRDLSPAARSAASSNEGGADGLMECVTQSCKINCSTRLEARARPKWCANFKVPDEANR